MKTRNVIWKEVEECIQECLNCHSVCKQLFSHFLHAEGVNLRQLCILLDCAQLCLACNDLMVRGSDFSAAICNLCVAVCRKCHDVCEELMTLDSIAQEGAEACSRCADSCARTAPITSAELSGSRIEA
jgi:hypothetical protein